MNQPFSTYRQPIRSRWLYAIAMVVVISLGLASRSKALGLSWFFAKYSGDALWGLVVFVGFGFLFTTLSTRTITALAVTFACCVEFAQLFHPAWLDAIRANTLGGLVLGTPESTFAWGDIAAYLVGITCGVAIELAVVFRRRSEIDE